jgi:hypothetical protein
MKLSLLILLLTANFGLANSQVTNKSNELLLVSPSGFKLQASNVVYQGETCSPSDPTDEVYSSSKVVRVGDEVFYESHRFYRSGRGEGFVVENFSHKTCRLYPMFSIADAAGQFNREEYTKSRGTPDDAMGVYRVGNTVWAGSNGIGVGVLDLEKRTWSRYDLKSNVIAGDHLVLNYADDDYAFATRGEFPGATFHVYSVKQNKWLWLKAVSTQVFSEYGHTTGMVQIGVDHSRHAKQGYMTIDWTFMGLEVIDKGQSYLFVKEFPDTKTVFTIGKSDLDRIFR